MVFKSKKRMEKTYGNYAYFGKIQSTKDFVVLTIKFNLNII